jgi:DUF971 family protein
VLRNYDPKTGKLFQQTTASSLPIQKIETKGTYGVGITWKDRSDIYTYDILKEIIDQIKATPKQ